MAFPFTGLSLDVTQFILTICTEVGWPLATNTSWYKPASAPVKSRFHGTVDPLRPLTLGQHATLGVQHVVVHGALRLACNFHGKQTLRWVREHGSHHASCNFLNRRGQVECFIRAAPLASVTSTMYTPVEMPVKSWSVVPLTPGPIHSYSYGGKPPVMLMSMLPSPVTAPSDTMPEIQWLQAQTRWP